METFSASNGWIANFVKQYALRTVSLHGEGRSVNSAELRQGLEHFCKASRDYDLKWIFNVAEKGLFFKLLPRHSYVIHSEDRKKDLWHKGHES